MSNEADVADWVKVAELDRCPPGNLLDVEVGDVRIVLANVAGDIYALEDECSHQEFPLSDGELEVGAAMLKDDEIDVLVERIGQVLEPRVG